MLPFFLTWDVDNTVFPFFFSPRLLFGQQLTDISGSGANGDGGLKDRGRRGQIVYE